MEALREALAADRPIVGAAVGSGIAAAAAEEGGADLLMVLSAGHFRLHGTPSLAALLPYSNANDLTWEIATRHVMTRVRKTPVVVGVCAQDPALDLGRHFELVKQYGIAGVTNFPSVAFYDGRYREALEKDGLGYDREVEMLREAKRRGLLTVGFCLSPPEAAAMARAGVDVLCLNLGLAEWRNLDPAEHQAALDRAVAALKAMLAAAKAATPSPYAVVFGGPVLTPQDTLQVYERTDARGYVGGSSIERFPAAAAITQTVRELKQVSAPGRRVNRLGAMIGTGPAMQSVFETVRNVAESDAPVLVVGESGTGKELAAREIHRLGGRSGLPLVTWNCGATSEGLAMSELFGHEKGAFTGATRAHVGKFELAQGGTLFMDEVSDLPASVQASLLRVLQEKEIVRVGGEKSIAVNVRLIAASNREFTELIPAGRFRLDLYYRLSTVVLRMPPLRERREDIPFLVLELAQELSQKYGCPVPRVPESIMNAFVRHAWPGNIRELRNAVERCFLLGKGRTFSKAWLEEMFAVDHVVGRSLPASAPPHLTAAQKRERLPEVLERHKGNKTAAARELGVTRKTVHKWLRR